MRRGRPEAADPEEQQAEIRDPDGRLRQAEQARHRGPLGLAAEEERDRHRDPVGGEEKDDPDEVKEDVPGEHTRALVTDGRPARWARPDRRRGSA